MFKPQAAWERVKQIQGLKLWEDQIYINEDFSGSTVEKRRISFKRAKEIRERGELALVAYKRIVSH